MFHRQHDRPGTHPLVDKVIRDGKKLGHFADRFGRPLLNDYNLGKKGVQFTTALRDRDWKKVSRAALPLAVLTPHQRVVALTLGVIIDALASPTSGKTTPEVVCATRERCPRPHLYLAVDNTADRKGTNYEH